MSRRPWSAVCPAIGTAAACSKVRFAGIGTMLAPADVLGERTRPRAEHRVAGLMCVTFAPTASTTPATSMPRIGRLRRAEALAQAGEVRLAAHHVPVVGVDRGRANAHQHAVLGRAPACRPPRSSHDIGRAVSVADDCFHRSLSYGVRLMRTRTSYSVRLSRPASRSRRWLAAEARDEARVPLSRDRVLALPSTWPTRPASSRSPCAGCAGAGRRGDVALLLRRQQGRHPRRHRRRGRGRDRAAAAGRRLEAGPSQDGDLRATMSSSAIRGRPAWCCRARASARPGCGTWTAILGTPAGGRVLRRA